jgi:purine-binding chemotaxis protein CheW
MSISPMVQLVDTFHDEVERIRRRLDELRRSFDDDVRHAPVQHTVETEEYLLLTLAGEAYAYPVVHALEIVPAPKIIPVPRVPTAILGIINFRGQILSVTAIAGLLGLDASAPGPNSRVIVTKALPLFTGILVDGIERIIDVAPEDIQPLPVTLDSEKQRLLTGQIRVDHRIAFVLDMRQLCGSESLRASREPSPAGARIN